MKKYDNYCAHLRVLSHAGEQDLENEFIISGIIDKFFIQFELGWKVLKELLLHEGIAAAKSGSPREIIKEAYRYYHSIDEKTWLSMLAQRNNIAHIYDKNAARTLVREILDTYLDAFIALQAELEQRYGEELRDL